LTHCDKAEVKTEVAVRFSDQFYKEPCKPVTDKVKRYQISGWAAQISTGYHHSGYYVVDTVTGKVVDRKSEAHSSKE
jgi:hypothetical protein